MKNLKTESKSSELKYRNMVEFSKDAILLVDINNKVLEWNRGAENLYGYKRDEVIGKELPIVPKSKLKELDRIRKLLKNGECVQNYETQRIDKNGFLRDVVLTLSPIEDKNKNIKAISSIARDITDENRLKRQIQQTEKLSGIGRLAAGIAHQLNTPLTSIKLSAQMLQDDIDNKECLHDIKRIVRQTDYCKNIINKLLTFSRPSGLEKRVVRLNPLIDNIEKLLEKVLKNKNIKFQKNILHSNDKIRANKNKVEQIFFNILSNAIDAISKKGQINISTESKNNNRIYIKINDTGSGIKKKDIPIIFDPFFTTKKVGEGTGLGLYICYGLIKEHDGTIEVDSKVGKGTTFTISFPLITNKK